MNLKFNEYQSMFLKQAFGFFSSTPEAMNKQDLDRLLRVIGKYYEPAELVEAFEQVDERNNETIGFDGFLTLMAKVTEGDKNTELHKIYRKFDRDGNGSLSASEIKDVMAKNGNMMSTQQIDILLSLVGAEDTSFEDFCKIVHCNFEDQETLSQHD